MSSSTYPLTTNPTVWGSYLNRKLTTDEHLILKFVESENRYNKQLDNLANIASAKNLHIPALTDLYGNCLFESLQILNVIDDYKEFRKDIAFMMKIFKNDKLFEIHDETLETLFGMYNEIGNEIGYVVNSHDNKLYKYTYDIMCKDLSNNNSWTRTPTELVLLCISYILDIKIIIISDTTTYVHEIYVNTSKAPYNTIYLGHLGEIHYVPLAKNEDGKTYVVPKYTESRLDFHKWARKMAHKEENAEEA